MGPFSPSQKLDEWHPNIPKEYLKTDPEKKHSEDGYVNFSHIELEVLESDVLCLHHDGHIRFKVDNQQNLFYLSAKAISLSLAPPGTCSANAL